MQSNAYKRFPDPSNVAAPRDFSTPGITERQGSPHSEAAFSLYRITSDPIRKCSLSLAFSLYPYSFGAVQVQNSSSFLAGTKLYLITGAKLYRIALSSVNARLIRNTFVSDQKVIWYSENAAKVVPDHFI